MRTRSLAVVVALLAVACATPESDDVALSEAVSEDLADGADRLAEALEAEDDCGALAEADAIERRVDAIAASGEAPETVLTETIRVVAALTVDLRCTPDDEDEDEISEDETSEDDGPADDASDPGEAQDPAPEPGPSDDAGSPGQGNGPPSNPGQGAGSGRGP